MRNSSWRSRAVRTLVCAALVAGLLPAGVAGGATPDTARPTLKRDGFEAHRDVGDGARPKVRVRDAERLNVKWAPGVPQSQIDAAATRLGFEIVATSRSGWTSVKPTGRGATLGSLASALKQARLTNRVTEEKIYTADAGGLIPNDPLFDRQFGLHNTGQKSGTPGADIKAPAAWQSRGTGSSSVVVAVVDTGVDRNHADLKDNMWLNTGEIPGNGRDDDRNGYVDDRYGFDFYSYDSSVYDPADGDQHGTHVAGIIGATGNNGTGVAGVNWDVTIMPVKFLGPWGGGDFEGAEAIRYAVDNGADVINCSWGGGFSELIDEAIAYAAERGVLLCVAAGNAGEDIDALPADWRPYPASSESTAVITVASTDRNDELSGFSNFGADAVDVAAPGEDILSTLPNEPTAFYINKLPYRIAYLPFAAEALEPAGQRDAIITKSLGRLAPSLTSPVMIVDDSMSVMTTETAGERLAVYTGALAGAGYSNVSTWNTETQGAPTAAQMRGKIVVWFTGRTAAGWYGEYCVNAEERVALQAFLDGGGRLLLASGEFATDMQFFGWEEEWMFSIDYFHIYLVDLMSYGSEIKGKKNTALAGLVASIPDTYQDWETRFAPTGSDSVYPIDQYITPMATIGGYGEFSGTSMAAPMVSGAAALLMSALPAADAEEIRARIENTVDELPGLRGKLSSNGRINLARAFDTYPGRPTIKTPAPGKRMRTGETEVVSWVPARGGSTEATFQAEYGIPYTLVEEGFESGDLAGFETTGAVGWSATNEPSEVYSGSWGIRSGDVPAGYDGGDGWFYGRVSVVETTVVVPDGGGVASFQWWWDADNWETTAVFEVDDRIVDWPWDTFDWTERSVALAEGEHTLRWTFVRFRDVPVGRDGVGVDDFKVTAWEYLPIGETAAGDYDLDWVVPAVDTSDARIRVRSSFDGVSSSWAYSRGLRISTDVVAPGPVTDLTATPDDDGHVALSWTNPGDSDFERVKLLARSDMMPTGPDDPDATIVYEGDAEEMLDGPRIHGTMVHYAAYATDAAENWATAATAHAEVVDTVAPEAVVMFDAEMFEGAPAVSWSNPAEGSFESVKVVRRTDRAPTGPNDTAGGGVVVYEGSANYAIDFLLASKPVEKTAYYGAWAVDLSGNTSPGAFDTLLVDTKPPSGWFEVNGNEWHAMSTSLVVANKVSGATEMRLFANEIDDDADWVPYAAAAMIDMLDVEGPQNVIGQYRDAAGNLLELSVEVYVNLGPPRTPEGLTARAVGGKIKLEWTDPRGEVFDVGPFLTLPTDPESGENGDDPYGDAYDLDIAGWNVWMSESPSGPWDDSLPFAHSSEILVAGLTEGRTYYFKITAVDMGGYESDESEVVSATAGRLINRSAGLNRYATSAAISKRAFDEAGTVIVASGASFPDALSAAALAGYYDAPVLLTAPASLSTSVTAEIARLGAEHAIIIGGTGAIAPGVSQALEGMGLDVSRIAGVDRFDTAALVARELTDLNGAPEMVFLVNGLAFPDAMAASPLAYQAGMPILLTRPGSMPATTLSALEYTGAHTVVAVGGTAAVSDAQLEELPLGYTRVAGADRYATAAELAEFGVWSLGVGSFETVGLASGLGLADGLAGGAAVGRMGGLLLLTNPAQLSPATRWALENHAHEIAAVEVYGGMAAVSTSVTKTVRSVVDTNLLY